MSCFVFSLEHEDSICSTWTCICGQGKQALFNQKIVMTCYFRLLFFFSNIQVAHLTLQKACEINEGLALWIWMELWYLLKCFTSFEVVSLHRGYHQTLPLLEHSALASTVAKLGQVSELFPLTYNSLANLKVSSQVKRQLNHTSLEIRYAIYL